MANHHNYNSNNRLRYITRAIFVIIVIFFSLNFCFAQKNASTKKTITAEFLYEEVEYKEIAVMTNVLKIKNNNGKNYTFSVSVNIPPGWKTLNNPDREYTLKPNDSAYVPIRLITSDKKAKGGTKYSISAYINTNEGKQMAYARFLAGRPKKTNWQMQILPRPRIYLLNGENTAQFQVNLSNDGDEAQEVVLSMNKIGKDFLVKDTTGKILKRNYIETSLAPYSDTTIGFNVQILEKVRNQNRIDIWGYNPSELVKEKRYGLFLRASEVRLEKLGGSQQNKKVDFIKLANNIDFVKLNNTTSSGSSTNTIPLTVFANINNVLGQQPIMTLIFQGNSQIGKYSSINYQLQTNFAYYKYSNDFISDRLTGNFMYNFKKGYFGIGYAGFSGFGGKGVMAGYRLNSKNTLNAFYARQQFFGPSNFNSFGLGYIGNVSVFRINLTSAAQIINTGINGYGLNANVSFNALKNIVINFGGGYIERNILLPNKFTNINYFFAINRNTKRLNSSINARYGIVEQNLFTQSLRNYNLNFSLFNRFSFKSGRGFMLSNSYNQNTINSISPDSSGRVFIGNNLLIIFKQNQRKFQWSPNLFFNYSRNFIDTIISGGTQLNFNKSDLEHNLFFGSNLRLSYNQLLNAKDLGIFFTAQANVFARYKVWNIIGLYNYGPLGMGDIVYTLKNDKAYPQTIRLSAGHQYQFKDNHFVWENNPVYMYMNTLKRHSFSINSQFFYFTNNYLRLGVNINFNVLSGFSYRYNYTGSGSTSSNFTVEEVNERSISKSFNLGFSIKKDFSLPIPKRFRKNKFCDAKFVVFLDVNGNRKMDDGEVPVENVVLRMNDYEVITDINGTASFINMSFAKYRLNVFPLIDMGSWFPNVNDSVDVCGPDLMYIPFSKGVQVYGGVELDREAFTGEIFDKLDVSRFKIYMIDSIGRTYSSITDNKGNYNFYVPYAKYTLKFDEKALGSNFYLAENDISLDFTNGMESYYHNFLIIEKKRRVKKKIFNADGSVTLIDEDAGSKKTDKDKDGKSLVGKNGEANNKNNLANNGNGSKNGNQGKDGSDAESPNYQSKEQQLDSLINVLNRLIARAATRLDVRAIVKQEMQKLIDELNASFTISIEELPKGKNPTGMLMQLLRLNKVIETKLPNGSRVYTSGDYKNISDAEKFCRDYQTSGFKKAKVVKKIPQK